MTKGEILKKLREINSHMDSLDVNNKQIDNAEKLQQIMQKREELNRQIEDLENKLKDDRNYFAPTGLISEQEKASFTRKIKDCNHQLDILDIDMSNFEERIRIIDSEIDSANFLISEGKKENTDYSKIMSRHNQDPNDPIYDEYLNRLNANNRAIEYLNNSIDLMKKEKIALNEKIKATKEEQKGLLKQVKTFEKEVNENHKEDSKVNKITKNRDLQLLDSLKLNEQVYAVEEDRLTNSIIDLNAVIKSYDEGKITDSDLKGMLQFYEDGLSIEYFDTDITKRANEIVDIEKSMGIYEKEAQVYRDRLKDEDYYKNYHLTVWNIDKYNQDIAEIEEKIADLNAKNSFAELDLNGLKDDDKNVTKEIALSQNNIDLYWTQIRTSEPEEYEEILNNNTVLISAEKDSIKKNQALSDVIKEEIALKKAEIQKGNLKIKRYQAILDSKKESIEKKSSINSSAKRIDEMKLAQLESGLLAFKIRKDFLEYDSKLEIDNLIGELGKETITKAGLDEETITTENKEEPILEPVITEPIEEKIEEPVIEEPIVEETVEEPIAEEPIIENDDNQAIIDQAIDELTREDENKDELVPVLKPTKLSKIGELNQKIKNKLKDKEFIKKAKRVLITIVAVGGVITAALLLKSCSADDIQTPPQIEDTLPDDDIKNEDEFIIETEEPTVEPEVVTPVTPQTPVIPQAPVVTPEPIVTPQPTPIVTPQPTPVVTPEPTPIITPVYPDEPIIEPEQPEIPVGNAKVEIGEGETFIINGMNVDNSNGSNDNLTGSTVDYDGTNGLDAGIQNVTTNPDGTMDVYTTSEIGVRDEILTDETIEDIQEANGVTSEEQIAEATQDFIENQNMEQEPTEVIVNEDGSISYESGGRSI